MPSATRKTTARGASATASKARAKAVAAEASEYVEVTGGGDFPATWNFEEQGDLEGVFVGTEIKLIKGKDRTIHNFEVDGEPVNVWGAAILDSRLSDIEAGDTVKVVKTGAKIATKAGFQAAEYKAFVRRAALNPRR